MKKTNSMCVIFAILGLFICSCAPRTETSSFFRRGILECGRIDGSGVALREFRGSWSEPVRLELGITSSATGALGFASGLIAILDTGKLRFHGPVMDGWTLLPERDFRLPPRCRSVLDFEADSLALGFARQLRFYRFSPDRGWAEDKSLRLSLPGGWQAVFTYGYTSIGIVMADEARLWERRGRGWEIAVDGGFSMPAGWRSVFGFQANGAGIVLEDRIVFKQYLSGGWSDVPSATLPLGVQSGSEDHSSSEESNT